jgi:amino acid-DNA transferase-like protein
MSEIFYSPAGAMHQTLGRYCDLSGVPEVQALEAGMDFRRPELRREVFLRFYEHSLRYRSFPGCVYFVMPHLYETFHWDREARLWFAFLNGNTQNPVTSWIIFKRFPELATLNIDDLDRWFNHEFIRLAFDTDRRHQKSDFMQSVRCYQKLTRGNQAEYFSGLAKTEDPYENFRRVWKVVRNEFYSFGRLASFSYLEYLRIMGINLDCDQLFLEDMNGSKSHRNGLAKVLGRDDLDWHDSNPTGFNGKYTPEMLAWLEKEAALLLREARQRVAGQPFAHDVSYFTLESALCTYKSWHRPNRRYPGVYLDMLHDRIKKAKAVWPEEDLSLFWEARKRCLPAYLRLEDNPQDCGVKPPKQNHYRETGEVIMMTADWPCFENQYEKQIARKFPMSAGNCKSDQERTWTNHIQRNA